jgi:hypothetical protein
VKVALELVLVFANALRGISDQAFHLGLERLENAALELE